MSTIFTRDTHRAIVAIAGPDYTYTGVTGDSRKPSYARRGFLADLLTRQGGVCVVCGETANDPQVNHITASGPARRGFMPGVVFAGCKACNDRCARVFGTWADPRTGEQVTGKREGYVMVNGGTVPFDAMMRPDLVPMEHTANRFLRQS